MDPLSPAWQFVFYLAAVLCFVADSVAVRVPRVHLIALGLAFAFFVAAWNALALA